MRRCIYCLQNLEISAFNREHVIPESFGTFGGNTPTLDCVCAKCNKELGDNLISPFWRCSHEGLARYGLGLKEFDLNVHPRKLGQRIDQSAFKLNPNLPLVFANLKYELAGMEPPFRGMIRYLPQIGIWPDQFNLPIYFTALELEQTPPDLSKYSISEDYPALLVCGRDEYESDLRRLAAKCGLVGSAYRRLDPPERFSTETTIQVPKRLLRIPAYLAFNFAAHYLGHNEVLAADFDPVRRHIRWDEGDFADFTTFKENRHPFLNEEEKRRVFGSHFVAIHWSQDFRSLRAHVSLFGYMHYSVCLVSNYSGLYRPDWVIGRLFNWKAGTVGIMNCRQDVL